MFEAFIIFVIIIFCAYGIMIITPYVQWIIKSIASLFHKETEKEKHIKKIQERQRTEAELKGASFENQLRDMILYYFPGSKVRQNVIIRNGKVSKEIDLIAMTPKGFIVVEAKNFSYCKIEGDVHEKDWICTYNEKKQFHMYNPIYQVNSAIWNIKKHIHSVYFDKVVVFSDNCEVAKNILSEDCVFTKSEFEYYLQNLSEVENSPYSETFIEQIDSKLEQLDTVSREEHIRNVEKIRKINAEA